MAQGFVSLHRGEQDQAARAAVALVIRRGLRDGEQVNEKLVGIKAHEVLAEFGFPASRVGRWIPYAKAVAGNGERISNRRWMQYSSEVRAAAWQLADTIEERIDNPFPTND